MFYLKTECGFDAAHFLWGYDGKCRNIHGHRWRLVAEIKGETLSTERQTSGMLVDFGDLKKDVRSLCASFDHTLIYEAGSLKETTVAALLDEDFNIHEVAFRPTAENFSRYFFNCLHDMGYDVHRVEVYETPVNCAAYEG